MSYSPRQARSLAKQIFDRWGPAIAAATAGSRVPADFLAGFIGVEAGKDRRGRIVPTATRFEPHVYRALRELRDGKRPRPYQNITRRELGARTDAELKALATSWGPAQIMGWHTIKNLKRSIAELSDPATMFICPVELLTLVGGDHLRRGDWPSVMRIWNTGRPDGKTYHADYVDNALEVKSAYKQIARGGASPDPTIPSDDLAESPASPDPNGSDSFSDAEPDDETQNAAAAGDPRPSVFDRIDAAGDAIGKAEGAVSTVTRRADSVKSLWSTIVGLFYQVITAIVGFWAGIPREILIPVLVIGGALVLVYLVRQILLGLAREKAGHNANTKK